VAPKFSNGGRFTVYCDGGSPATGDLSSSTATGRQVVAYCHFEQSGNHTMRVVAEGTTGRPWFAVDAFVILS